MLLARPSEPDVRLPHQLGRMDIRDILKSSRSPSPPVKTEASAVDQPRSPERLPSVSLQVPLSSPGLAPPSTRSFPVLPPLSPRLYPSPEGNDTRHNSLNINNANQQAASRLEDASQAQPYGPSPAHHVNHSPQQSSLAAVSLPSNKRAAEDDDLSRPAAKKRHQQKWSPEEDSRIIELRGSGMKWAEIKNHLPGRTEIGCRLHYQNYLEKRGSWNDEMKTKLARVYERYSSPPTIPALGRTCGRDLNHHTNPSSIITDSSKRCGNA